MFEIPLGNVSHSTMGKNEVTLEFHQNDDAAVSLMELRFHVPGDKDIEVDSVEVNNSQSDMSHGNRVSVEVHRRVIRPTTVRLNYFRI